MPNSPATRVFPSPARTRWRSWAACFSESVFLAAPVGPALLGQGDALALPFPEQGPLELGEGPHDRQHQVRHRRVLAGEGQVLLDELDAYAAPGQLPHDAPQVVQVASQPIHAVHDHRVGLAHETEQPFQFRTLRVLSRSLVGKDPVEGDLLQLAFRVLVDAAHPDVADALTWHEVPPVSKTVKKESMTLGGTCQSMQITSLF